jgi:CDP-2,3-bis-(O-geranylgeranyl)-sn-glycerol synthase
MVDKMGISELIIEALIFIFPAYCANAAPVLAGGGLSMDLGKNFIDGKRIFGNNKTFRGFFFGLAIGVFVGLVESLIFSYPLSFSVLSPLGALLGDLTAFSYYLLAASSRGYNSYAAHSLAYELFCL